MHGVMRKNTEIMGFHLHPDLGAMPMHFSLRRSERGTVQLRLFRRLWKGIPSGA